MSRLQYGERNRSTGTVLWRKIFPINQSGFVPLSYPNQSIKYFDQNKVESLNLIHSFTIYIQQSGRFVSSVRMTYLFVLVKILFTWNELRAKLILSNDKQYGCTWFSLEFKPFSTRCCTLTRSSFSVNSVSWNWFYPLDYHHIFKRTFYLFVNCFNNM